MIQVNDAIKDLPIVSLEFYGVSTKAINQLEKSADCLFLWQLQGMLESDIELIRDFGPTNYREVKRGVELLTKAVAEGRHKEW